MKTFERACCVAAVLIVLTGAVMADEVVVALEIPEGEHYLKVTNTAGRVTVEPIKRVTIGEPDKPISKPSDPPSVLTATVKAGLDKVPAYKAKEADAKKLSTAYRFVAGKINDGSLTSKEDVQKFMGQAYRAALRSNEPKWQPFQSELFKLPPPETLEAYEQSFVDIGGVLDGGRGELNLIAVAEFLKMLIELWALFKGA